MAVNTNKKCINFHKLVHRMIINIIMKKSKKCNKMNLELCIGFGPMITVLRTIALTTWPTQQVGQTRFELVTYCL